MNEKTAIVVGDIMLDRRVEGEATRVSPEAPTLVVRQGNISCTLGGAANVAVNLAAMGIKTQLIGVVGNDEEGREVNNLLMAAQQRYPIWPRLLVGTAQTCLKTRITCDGQQVLRLDRDASQWATSQAVRAACDEAMKAADVGLVLVSDYNKGTLSDCRDYLSGLSQVAAVLIDTKPQLFEHYRQRPVLFTPNYAEALEYIRQKELIHVGFPRHDVKIDAPVACALVRHHVNADVVITCGKHGACINDEFIAGYPREIADPTGAGDTFLAAYGATLLQNLHMDASQLVDHANFAASLAVSRHGTAVVTAAEIGDARYKRGLPDTKHMNQRQLLEFVARARARGELIGFTNGCFDLLHPGHLQTLRFARDHCSVLIVAYNSDESVARLKGEGRPIVRAGMRAEMLEPYADVLIEMGDTPIPLLTAIRPDVYAKGGEYRSRGLIEAALVAKHGGQVLYSDMLPGHSTTLNAPRVQ
jgi:D-beta-D-heptose 7-phosphate kinase/D-beta-D-heptose 1-phosphate adenosyltransferase